MISDVKPLISMSPPEKRVFGNIWRWPLNPGTRDLENVVSVKVNAVQRLVRKCLSKCIFDRVVVL